MSSFASLRMCVASEARASAWRSFAQLWMTSLDIPSYFVNMHHRVLVIDRVLVAARHRDEDVRITSSGQTIRANELAAARDESAPTIGEDSLYSLLKCIIWPLRWLLRVRLEEIAQRWIVLHNRIHHLRRKR